MVDSVQSKCKFPPCNDWHDQNHENWLACPVRERLVEIETELESQLCEVTAALTRIGAQQ